jgi:hypothetical protein
MRQGQERNVAGGGHEVGMERLASEVDSAGEAGMERINAWRFILPRGRKRDPGARVPQEDPKQFAGGVS